MGKRNAWYLSITLMDNIFKISRGGEVNLKCSVKQSFPLVLWCQLFLNKKNDEGKYLFSHDDFKSRNHNSRWRCVLVYKYPRRSIRVLMGGDYLTLFNNLYQFSIST